MRDEILEPWGWLLALVVGGLAWALGVPVLAALGIAVLVFGTKVAIASAVGRRTPALTSGAPDALPAPPRNSPAAVLVARAEAALGRMSGLASVPSDPWLRSEVGRMDDGAGDVVAAMRDLAGRVTLAEQLLASANPNQLLAERATLVAQLEQTTDPLLEQERRRVLAAVDDQLTGLNRLGGLRDQLLARMQTAAIGMETIATRMGEIVTLGSVALEHDRATEVIGGASNELEALRTGLAEAQQLAREVGPA
ncbi:MAG: hypothetical protein H6525_12455 [Actinobacteria bacterium]|nr:hypothetical protein [Actinomycetota bacterium]